MLTEGQLSGYKVALLVSYSDVLNVDSLTLEAFSVIHSLGESGVYNDMSCQSYHVLFPGPVTKCGIKPVKNISTELSKLKLNSCDESLYM